MHNQEIRQIAKSNGVKLWQIAYKLGLTDGNFSRKLRKEFSEKEKERIYLIIAELQQEGEKTHE